MIHITIWRINRNGCTASLSEILPEKDAKKTACSETADYFDLNIDSVEKNIYG